MMISLISVNKGLTCFKTCFPDNFFEKNSLFVMFMIFFEDF
jgi:hypothetical protein